MQKFIQKFHWMDYVLLAIIIGFISMISAKIDGSLNYKWRWDLIPEYILRYDEKQGKWVVNLLLQGFITTIRISIYASILAVFLGLFLGIARCAENLAIRMLARTYLEFLRNIPPIVIVFIFYFFLSEQLVTALNIEGWARSIARQEGGAEIWEFFFGDMRRFPSLISGVIVLALFESAFVGEIIRAGIQSIDKDQREAARSIGLSRLDEMRFIIMPQAIQKVLPPLASQFILLIKDSAIISLISVQELTFKTTEVVVTTRAIFEAWITTAAFYFIICFGLSLLFRKLENKKVK